VIAIVDYGMGNRRSVEKALEHVGARAVITAEHDVIRSADGVILPGVGAFPKAMERIRERGLDELIAERVSTGVPVLGICLGLQLIFESSDERDGTAGLGLVDGPVSGLQADGLKVPHIGWSPVTWAKESRLTAGLAQAEPFYFVHSFAPRPANPDDVLGTAEYGERFVCAVERGNVFGAQFHPEKSSGGGLRLLRNFAGICASVPA
jgi:imidazole glycerol-phosphate synthase subunit HisH